MSFSPRKKKREVEIDSQDYGYMFKKFCESSTVHGTYFWNEADTPYIRALWILIVMCGIGSASYIINRSFLSWKTNPVITSVAQIPIEQVPFPSVTVCPQGNTAFGFPEQLANERGLAKSDIGRALGEMFLLITTSKPPLGDKHCLVNSCLLEKPTSSDCEHFSNFAQFIETARQSDNYSQILKSLLATSFPKELKLDPSALKLVTIKSKPSCNELARDFLLLKDFSNLLDNLKVEDVHAGSLLKWLHKNLESRKSKSEMFRSFFNDSAFPEVYTSSLGVSKASSSAHLAVPDLVETLTETDVTEFADLLDSLRGLRQGSDLLHLMRLSLHPPHVAEMTLTGGGLEGHQTGRPIPNPAFPFCFYQDRMDDGLKYGPYPERYCHDFQTTMNEKGLCYTYNNYDLGLDEANRAAEDDAGGSVQIRRVKGCGKSKGLQLVVDSQKLATQPTFTAAKSGAKAAKGFVIFVTVPGVVTHKVSFTIDTTFNGEHHFYLHGIHFIDSSKEFQAWNKDAKVCFFPDDHKLSYFSFYTQDNCLLECRYNKIANACHCAPWYLNQTSLPICGVAGNACFEERFKNYQEELQDRVDCNCRSDCEGIHFFASMNRYPFTDSTATDIRFWWDEEEQKGRLANYLLDPLNVFSDGLSKNISKLIYNISSLELASKRFHEDISILNFFFDTPIITRITLEMRITVFDQIAAIGGSLGLFTGVSLITFVEVIYWGIKFVLLGAKRAGKVGNSSAAEAPYPEGDIPLRSTIRQQYDKDFFGSNYLV